MVHGNQNINGHYYLISSVNGAIQTGWITVNGKSYYINNDGSYASGEREIDGNWYYFDPQTNDSLITNRFITLSNGRIVYYDQNGHMLHGWQTINGSHYHFDETGGGMTIGEYESGNNWFYLDNHGVEAVNQFVTLPNGRIVYYDQKGHMIYVEREINNHWYHFDEVGGGMSIGFTKLKDGRLVN